jgi:GMP synthase (glutamine-hydrolysing)
VYDKDSPHVDKAVFELGVPVLGICYGLQVRVTYNERVKPHPLRKSHGPLEEKLGNVTIENTDLLK